MPTPSLPMPTRRPGQLRSTGGRASTGLAGAVCRPRCRRSRDAGGRVRPRLRATGALAPPPPSSIARTSSCGDLGEQCRPSATRRCRVRVTSSGPLGDSGRPPQERAAADRASRSGVRHPLAASAVRCGPSDAGTLSCQPVSASPRRRRSVSRYRSRSCAVGVVVGADQMHDVDVDAGRACRRRRPGAACKVRRDVELRLDLWRRPRPCRSVLLAG